MINFELKYENLIEREIHNNLIVTETKDLNIIESCINLFNSEIVWDKMFTIKDAEIRIRKGDIFFVGYYDNYLFGYCWLTKNKIFKIYNVFSKNIPINRIYGATDLLYFVIKNYTSGIIISEVDEWNLKSINVFKKLGFNQKVW